jgi:ketosteroid isomerase-like protein
MSNDGVIVWEKFTGVGVTGKAANGGVAELIHAVVVLFDRKAESETGENECLYHDGDDVARFCGPSGCGGLPKKNGRNLQDICINHVVKS